MSIVHVPEPRHRCGPNRYGYWLDIESEIGVGRPVPGTVVECTQCGKSWVAYQDERDPGYVGVKWRREGWWARHRRHRRSVANEDPTSRILRGETKDR